MYIKFKLKLVCVHHITYQMKLLINFVNIRHATYQLNHLNNDFTLTWRFNQFNLFFFKKNKNLSDSSDYNQNHMILLYYNKIVSIKQWINTKKNQHKDYVKILITFHKQLLNLNIYLIIKPFIVHENINQNLMNVYFTKFDKSKGITV